MKIEIAGEWARKGGRGEELMGGSECWERCESGTSGRESERREERKGEKSMVV